MIAGMGGGGGFIRVTIRIQRYCRGQGAVAATRAQALQQCEETGEQERFWQVIRREGGYHSGTAGHVPLEPTSVIKRGLLMNITECSSNNDELCLPINRQK